MSSMVRMVRIFLDTDMRCGHKGLINHAATHGVKLEKMSEGEHAVFLNPNKNKVKLYSYNGLMSYLILDKDSEFTMEALKEIPKTFDRQARVTFTEGFRKTISKELKIKLPSVVHDGLQASA